MKAHEFKIYCGPMFATKTSRLLMELDRYKYQKVHTLVIKPSIDDRFNDKEIVTHSGWTHAAYCVKDASEILDILANLEDTPRVIAVDEAFMIPGIADVLIFLYRSGFNVVVATLDFASNGKPFPEVVKMLPWATKIEKCSAVCTVCNEDALYTHKKVSTVDEFSVEIGGSEDYEPRCTRHYPTIFDIRI